MREHDVRKVCKVTACRILRLVVCVRGNCELGKEEWKNSVQSSAAHGIEEQCSVSVAKEGAR